MITNGQNDSLWHWFEQELHQIDSYDEQQPFALHIFMILKQIDGVFFEELPQSLQESIYLSIFTLLQKYLEVQMGKKIKPLYRNKIEQILNHCKIPSQPSLIVKEILPFILYICINSKQKSAFITRILQLPETLQNQLMENIKFIQQVKLENIIETKQIIEQINVLSKQKSALSERLWELMEKNRELQSNYKENLEENQILLKVVNRNRGEKAKIVQMHNINQIYSYSEMIEGVSMKKEKLLNLIEDTEISIGNNNEEIKEIEKKIDANQQVIQDLRSEILKYKDKYLEVLNESIDNLPSNSLDSKRRNSLIDSKSQRIPLLDRSCSQNIHEISSSHLNDSGHNLLKYNGQLMEKFVSMQQKIRKITEYNETIASENKILEKENFQYEGIFKLLAKQETQFLRKYPSHKPLKLGQSNNLKQAIIEFKMSRNNRKSRYLTSSALRK